MSRREHPVTDEQVWRTYKDVGFCQAAHHFGFSDEGLNYRLKRIRGELKYKFIWNRPKKVSTDRLVSALKLAGSVYGAARICGISRSSTRKRLLKHLVVLPDGRRGKQWTNRTSLKIQLQ